MVLWNIFATLVFVAVLQLNLATGKSIGNDFVITNINQVRKNITFTRIFTFLR